eukprot:2208550-Pyramimonas_sp.AAC.2
MKPSVATYLQEPLAVQVDARLAKGQTADFRNVRVNLLLGAGILWRPRLLDASKEAVEFVRVRARTIEGLLL